MTVNIDVALEQAFTEGTVKQSFGEYLEAKWDQFSSPKSPKIKMQFGADGVTYQSFYKQLDRHASNICRRIKDDNYYFYPFREEKKEKKPKGSGKYRLISVASLRDILVQKILYDLVLYEPLEAIFHKLDMTGVVSFGYRKHYSAPKAAQKIHEYIASGYLYVLDADICKFFDMLNQEQLLAKVAAVIGGTDSKTYRLVERFVRADRVEEKTYINYGKKVFHNIKPETTSRVAGVPQGGVLSGLLSNLYLHEFDVWVTSELGSSIDLQYVRYADDFIILTRSYGDLEQIRNLVDLKLSDRSLDVEMHPTKSTLKCLNLKQLDFVGFSFDQKNIYVKEDNIRAYQEEIENTITQSSSTMQSIQPDKAEDYLRKLSRRISNKILGLSIRQYCPKCGFRRKGSPRSWISFFKVVTDKNQIRDLDRWTREQVYKEFNRKFNMRLKRSDFNKVKFRSLMKERYRVRKRSLIPCLCDLDKSGIWDYAYDLFRRKYFKTISEGKLFRVSEVTDDGLFVQIEKREFFISKDVLLSLWTRLRLGETITRAQIEKEGIKNSSQVVALIESLPGIWYMKAPITIWFMPKKPHFQLQII